jgi:hypothetical protein
MDVPQGLCHVHVFIDETVEKSITYICLMNLPVFHENNGVHSSDGDRLYNRAIGFNIINTWLLVKTLSNKSCFISVDAPINFPLYSKYPLGAHNVHGWRLVY